MKNEKGITLTALVVTIILILIIASIATTTSLTSYRIMKAHNFVAKMQVIQDKVNIIMEEYENWKISSTDNSSKTIVEYCTELGFTQVDGSNASLTTSLTTIISALGTPTNSWVDSSDSVTTNYFYFSEDDIQDKLGIANISDVEVFVNFYTGNVIEKTGVPNPDDTSKTIYRQYDYSTGEQLIAYSEDTDTPSISIEVTANYGSSQEVTISSDKSIQKVYYKTSSMSNYSNANVFSNYQIYEDSSATNPYKSSFTIDKSGDYTIYIVGTNNVSSSTESLNVELVNPPVLVDGMTPVTFDSSGNVTEVDSSNITSMWYDYSSSSKKWANAVTKDGSYWVWIPRYAYKTDLTQTNYGTIDIEFVSGVSNTTYYGTAISGEVMHCFQNGTGSSFSQGEWDSEITGIWVAKFNASRSDATDTTVGSSTTISSKPSVKVNTGLSLGNAYDYCLAMKDISGFVTDSDSIDTHLMKNSEWGAVAYLAYSVYGRDTAASTSSIITKTTNSIAGGGTSKTSVFSTSTYLKCSSTENAYGIYDLVTSNGNLVAAGLSLTKFGSATSSTKYATLYGTSLESSNIVSGEFIIGDAIKDVYLSSSSTTWLSYTATYVTSGSPIFLRGVSGIFSFEAVAEDTTSNAFRPVLICK